MAKKKSCPADNDIEEIAPRGLPQNWNSRGYFHLQNCTYIFRQKSRTGWLESRSEIAKIYLTATSAHKVKIGEMHFIQSAIKKSAPSKRRRKSLLTIGNNINDTG